MDDEKDFLMNIAGEISRVKGDMMPLEHYYSANCSKDVFEEIYTGYEQKLRRMRRLDYDDMLVQTWRLFKERPDILLAWQKKYKYILIDEFQDINRIQYEIIRMMAKPEDNLFVVGDDRPVYFTVSAAQNLETFSLYEGITGAEMAGG